MRLGLEALAEDDLEDVARADVLLAALDSRLVASLGEIRRVRQRRLADGVDVRELQVGNALVEAFHEAIHPLARPAVTPGEVRRIDVSVGDDGDGLRHVVEDDHSVVQRETEVRQAAVVRRRGRQAFDVANGVVPGVADRPAGESRQAGDGRRSVSRDVLFQERQRVGVVEFLRLPAFAFRRLDLDACPEGEEAQERPGADEAVASQTLAADDALEQEGPFVLLHLAERRHGRERVAR